MANKDLFAPPTKQELQQDDLFAPPSEQELNQPVSVNQELTEPQMSQADAAGLGSLQGLTWGFADELKAGVQAPFSDKTYEQIRDEERALYAAAEKQHPGTFLAADIGSGLASGGTLVKGLKAAGTMAKDSKYLKKLYDTYMGLSKAKQAATAAAATGAVEGLGRTEEDTALGMAQDVATTGALSGILGGVAGKVSDNFSQKALASKAAEKAKDANTEALQAIGATSANMAEEIGAKTSKRAGIDTAKGTGNVLLEQDLIKTMDKPEETVRKINEKLDEVYSTKLAKNAEQIDEKLITKQNDVANATSDFANNSMNIVNNFQEAARYTLKDGPALSEGAGNVLNNLIQDLANAPANKKLSKAIQLRQTVRDMTNFNKSDIPQAQQFYKEIYNNLNQYIDNLSEMATDKKTMNEFKEANQLYGRLSDAREIAVDTLSKNLGNTNLVTQGDVMIPGMIGTVATAALGVPGVGAGLGALAAKKSIENKAGKSLPEIYKAYKAQKSFSSAKNLMDRSLNYGNKDKIINDLSSKTLGVIPATVTSATVDDIKMKQNLLRQSMEKSTPEELQMNAQNIRSKYGKDGNRVANEIEKMANKDVQGRRAAFFSLTQDLNNRRMLMDNNLMDEVDNVDVDEDGEF